MRERVLALVRLAEERANHGFAAHQGTSPFRNLTRLLGPVR